jgi:hypothetical protein
MDEQFNHNLRMKRNTPTTGKNGTLSFGVPINVHTEGATNALGNSIVMYIFCYIPTLSIIVLHLSLNTLLAQGV